MSVATGASPRRLRLAFMGSPDFAVPSLHALREAGHHIAAVYCQPPRPAGRGQRERLCPVHGCARDRGLEVRTPASLKEAGVQDDFAALGPDAAVVVAYGLILPPPILAAPRLGCLNVHASLLPRWRGAAPIQRVILAGDDGTGVTIVRMDAGLDTGPILLSQAVPLSATTTVADLHETLAALGASLVVRALGDLDAGRLKAKPQPAEGVTYAAKLARDEGRLDWRHSAVALERMPRGLNPWPGAWFIHQGRRIKVLDATVAALPHPALPGTVLDDRLTIACGRDALRLTTLQREGRGPLAAAAFLRGYALPAGTVLP